MRLSEILGDSQFARRLDRIQSNNSADPKIDNGPVKPKETDIGDDEVVDASTQPTKDDKLGKNWQNIRHFK
jgi:hypothetical protein